MRYLPGRFLPDKAIDLVDEACAAARIRAEQAKQSKPTLMPDDIAHVVAQASGVPVERVGEQERERLDKLEERLNAEIVGQSRAVAAVAGAIRRSRTGLGEPGRPMGAMLFLGPTGVGKTALARALAVSWFGSEKPCSNLICRSIRNSTPLPGCWVRRRAIWAMTRADS